MHLGEYRATSYFSLQESDKDKDGFLNKDEAKGALKKVEDVIKKIINAEAIPSMPSI